jgi:hypothetical protein
MDYAEQREAHRSRRVRFVNSPHPTPAFGWAFAIDAFVSSDGLWPKFVIQLTGRTRPTAVIRIWI